MTGLVAQYPLGGVTWDYVQYVAGLARLGHDVYYMEDTGQWPFNPLEGGTAKSAGFNVSFLASAMSRFGLEGRWAYCFPWQSQWFGLPDRARKEVIGSADLVINVSGTLATPREYRGHGRLVYIDSDPVFTQVKIARGQRDFRRYVDSHDVHFSFGERMGPRIPDSGITWLPTRQPILLDEWGTAVPPTRNFTTVMNWSSYKPVEYQGRYFGQKDIEFRKYVELPAAVRPARLEIAMNAAGKRTNAPLRLLRRKGWSIVDPNVVAFDAESYRRYVQTSKAEWSVAKNGYVVGKPGWFSCRSACYLAAGRPVVAQDTGFSEVLPVGAGLFAFDSFDQAVESIRSIESGYGRHSRAARAIAEEYFDSDKVLAKLLEEAMNASR